MQARLQLGHWLLAFQLAKVWHKGIIFIKNMHLHTHPLPIIIIFLFKSPLHSNLFPYSATQRGRWNPRKLNFGLICWRRKGSLSLDLASLVSLSLWLIYIFITKLVSGLLILVFSVVFVWTFITYLLVHFQVHYRKIFNVKFMESWDLGLTNSEFLFVGTSFWASFK